MLSDNLLLVFSFLIFWVTLLFYTVIYSRKRALLLHGIINLAYTAYFTYGLVYESEGGAGLLWWFYWLLLTGIHWLTIVVLIAYKEITNKKP
jgi:hypothetical protein